MDTEIGKLSVRSCLCAKFRPSDLGRDSRERKLRSLVLTSLSDLALQL
jgi:hypothetical protein